MPPTRDGTSRSDAAAAAAVGPAFRIAGWSVAVGLGMSFLAVLLSGGADGPLSTLRSAARIWTVAHGSGLRLNDVMIGAVPWGAVLLAIAVVARVTARVIDDPLDEPDALVATVAGAMGAAGAVLAAIGSAGSTSVGTLRAAAAAFAVGLVGAVVGVLASQGPPARWWPAEQPGLRAVVSGAAVAVAGVVGAATLIVVLRLVLAVPRAGDLWAGLNPGAAGGLVLAIGCLLAIPTLVLWTVAVLIGPGFIVGTGSSVDLSGSSLGTLPGLPVLAGLPEPGAFSGLVVVLAAVPAVAAAGAGWFLVRSGRVDVSAGWAESLPLVAGAGALAGGVLGLAARLSAGSVGPGRMAEVGPTDLAGLLVAVPVMAVGAGIGAVLAHYRGGRAEQP